MKIRKFLFFYRIGFGNAPKLGLSAYDFIYPHVTPSPNKAIYTDPTCSMGYESDLFKYDSDATHKKKVTAPENEIHMNPPDRTAHRPTEPKGVQEIEGTLYGLYDLTGGLALSASALLCMFFIVLERIQRQTSLNTPDGTRPGSL